MPPRKIRGVPFACQCGNSGTLGCVPGGKCAASTGMRGRLDLSEAGRPIFFFVGGILAAFIDPLRDEGVPIFAISTHDTDYVLLKEEVSRTALDALRKAGHELITS